jgi:hypothetical protein
MVQCAHRGFSGGGVFEAGMKSANILIIEDDELVARTIERSYAGGFQWRARHAKMG